MRTEEKYIDIDELLAAYFSGNTNEELLAELSRVAGEPQTGQVSGMR